MDLKTILTLLFGAGLSFLAAWFWDDRKKAREERERLAIANEAQVKRIVELEKANALIAAQIMPLSAAFQAMIVKELTHFHTPELDALLEKIGPPNQLSADEMALMERLLAERAENLNGDIPQSEREAAAMLPMVMKRAAREALELEINPAASIEMRMVAVPEDPTTEPIGGPEARKAENEKSVLERLAQDIGKRIAPGIMAQQQNVVKVQIVPDEEHPVPVTVPEKAKEPEKDEG